MAWGTGEKIKKIAKEITERQKGSNQGGSEYYYDGETGLLKFRDFHDYRKLVGLRKYFIDDMRDHHGSIALALHHASLTPLYEYLAEKYGEKVIRDDLIYVGLNLEAVRDIVIGEYREIVIGHKYRRLGHEEE
ncbi:hypothetical protein J7J18_02635 [bacterium]|nr:hypothetical protein [bacterium]